MRYCSIPMNENRERVIALRLNDREYAEVKAAADAERRTLADFARARVMKSLEETAHRS